MYENVHPNLALVLLFVGSEVECGKGLFLMTVILFGASAGVLTLISWRSCRGAQLVMHLGSTEKERKRGYVTLEKRRESHVRNLVKKCLSNRCPQFFMHYFN